jgi:hypothetical protein
MIKEQIQAVENDAKENIEKHKKCMTNMGMYMENPRTRSEIEMMEIYNNGVRAIRDNADRIIKNIITDMASITKRKGCNYCIRGKSICTNAKILAEINDDDCNGNAGLVIRPHAEFRFDTETIKINYCPICGKELKE